MPAKQATLTITNNDSRDVIDISVLSVISTQIKTIQNAITNKHKKF